MSVFTVTAAAKNAAKLVPPSWYPLEITGYRELVKPDNVVHIFEFLILEGENRDVPVVAILNNKMPEPIVKLIEATIGEVEAGAQLDMKDLVGKQVDGYAKPETYDGRTSNKAEDFRPIGFGR